MGNFDFLKLKFADLHEVKPRPLPVRVLNALAELEIETVGELIEKTERELLKVRNFSHSSLQEVKGFLKRNGFHLGFRGNKQCPFAVSSFTTERNFCVKDDCMAWGQIKYEEYEGNREYGCKLIEKGRG